MIYVDISGGLGNQLYKYATGYSVAKETGQKLVLDRTLLDTIDFRDYELDGLKVHRYKDISWNYKTGFFDRAVLNRLRRLTDTNYAFLVRETRGACEYYPEIFDIGRRKKNIYLMGGWQNYRHFQKYRKEICQMLVPNFTLKGETSDILDDIEHSESVAIHIRRGDYVKLGITLDSKYYFEAVKITKERLKSPSFFVFSEDIGFSKELFSEFENDRFVYVEHQELRNTITDFYLMRKCKHQIIANSSFSWWAAYTNENDSKIVLCPDGGEKDAKRNGLYPDDWIIV